LSDKVFVDTNVLVYAHDVDAGRRHAVATRLVAELWETRRAVTSTQVLQEFSPSTSSWPPTSKSSTSYGARERSPLDRIDLTN
jgi:predicted nucleic acid-binding protein